MSKLNSGLRALVLFVVLICTANITLAQNTLNNIGYTTTDPKAEAAYSLRLLSSNYTGPLVRITIGANKYDVWPDASGVFSLTSVISTANPTSTPGTKNGTTALSTVVGTSNATINIWYDQSGSSRNNNVIQATTSNQPRIINAGVVDKQNGKPSALFTQASSQQLVATSNTYTNFGSGHSVLAVYARSSTGTTGGLFSLNGGVTVNPFLNFWSANSTSIRFESGINPPTAGANIQSTTQTISANTLTQSSGTGIEHRKNGSSLLTGSSAGTLTSSFSGPFIIGNHYLSHYWSGYISEIICFPTTLSNTQRQTAENNQTTYYATLPCTSTSSTTNLSICPSALPYSWNGLTFTATGSQTKTGLVNAGGCDSSATLNLTVKSTTSSTTNLSVCTSALPYSWNGLTFTATGSQTKTGLINSVGCDSSATLNLTIKSTTSSSTNLSICSSELPYSWNALTFTAAGSQTKTGLTNSFGCDSSATLNLSIKANYTITASAGANGSITNSGITTVCENNSLTFNITANSGYFVADVLIDGASIGAVSSYTFSNVTANHTISVSFNASCVNTSSTTNLSICSNELPYSWNGLTFIATGSQTKTGLINAAGCDSSATLNLTVKSATTSSINLSICPSALPYSWNGLIFTAAGSQTAHLNNTAGCDSAATLNLSIKSTSSSTTNLSICTSELPYSWNGLTFTAAGSQTAHLTNAASCDSAATLIVTVKATSSSTTTVAITSGNFPYVWNGNTYNNYGTYTVNLINAIGCDSAATLFLVSNSQITGVSIIASHNSKVCYGTPITFTATAIGTNTSNNQLVIYKWLKNGQPVSTNTGSVTGNNSYTDSAMTNVDFMQCILLSTPSSVNSFVNDTSFASNVIHTYFVATPNGVPQLGFTKSIGGASEYATSVSANNLTQTLTGLCAGEVYYVWGKPQQSYISTISDSSKILGTQSGHILFGCNCDYIRFTTNGKDGIGVGSLVFDYYTNNNGYCSSTINYLIPVNAKNNLPQIQTVTGSNIVCVGGKIDLKIADSSGTWWGSQGLTSLGNGTFKLDAYKLSTALYGTFENPIVYYGYSKPIITGSSKTCTTSVSLTLPIQSGYLPLGVLSTGPSSVCLNARIPLANITTVPAGCSAYWTAADSRVKIDSGIYVTGFIAGTTNINYNIGGFYNGCVQTATPYKITVNPNPAIPTIAYAPNTPSPQTTSVGGVITLCKNKTFTLVGTPANGIWSKTGVISISPSGTPSTSTTVNTGNTAGATSVTYTITDANGCRSNRTFNANVVACASKGIASQSATGSEQLVIYPNPAHSVINVNVKTLSGTGSILLTDLYGKTVKQQPLSMGTNTINVNHLAKGMYLVSIITEQGKQTQKIVVE